MLQCTVLNIPKIPDADYILNIVEPQGELLVLSNDDHHADPKQQSNHFHQGLFEGGTLQQLRDDGDGGDVDEPSGGEWKSQSGGRLRSSACNYER